MLSGNLWPSHPHPYPDELLSSWLVRIAHANGLKVQTFCDREFGQDHQLWNRDIDRLAPGWLIATLSKKTGTSTSRVLCTTLSDYQSLLYEHPKISGQLRWILPLLMYHRKRQGYGLQYCPQCLAEGTEPYYCRAWRVAFYTYCPVHKILLLDRCPRCGNGLAFHRTDLGKPSLTDSVSLEHCWQCGFDLSTATSRPVVKWDTPTFDSWDNILELMCRGALSPFCVDCSKLAVLHHLCALLVSVRLAPKLQAFLCAQTEQPHLQIPKIRMPFEQYPHEQRHYICGLAWWLLARWPNRLRSAWEAKAIRYNVLLKDFHEAPSWYTATVKNLLRHS